MVRDYELMYIVRPDLDEEALQAATDSVDTLIRGQGGEIEKTTMWGKRRLAYEVKHLRDGHYVISYIRLDGTKVAEIERALRIHDTVFRHLLVVRESTAELEGVSVDGDVAVPTSVALVADADEEQDSAPAADDEDEE